MLSTQIILEPACLIMALENFWEFMLCLGSRPGRHSYAPSPPSHSAIGRRGISRGRRCRGTGRSWRAGWQWTRGIITGCNTCTRSRGTGRCAARWTGRGYCTIIRIPSCRTCCRSRGTGRRSYRRKTPCHCRRGTHCCLIRFWGWWNLDNRTPPLANLMTQGFL